MVAVVMVLVVWVVVVAFVVVVVVVMCVQSTKSCCNMGLEPRLQSEVQDAGGQETTHKSSHDLEHGF